MRDITLALLRDLTSNGTPLRILDAGGGSGDLDTELQCDHRVVTLDLTHPALRFAQKNGAERPVCGSVEQLPFPDSTFDISLCLDVLYHVGIDDNRRALAELWRVLRPGGHVLVRTPAFEALKGPHDVALQTMRRFTASELRCTMEVGGFRVQRVTYANTWLFPLEACWRLLKRRRARGQPSSDLLSWPAWANRTLSAILSSEKLFLRTRNLPVGLSVYCLANKPANN
jgi:SAM-dependent methyltransferase